MRILTFSLSVVFTLSLSAQSLQDSFNSALKDADQVEQTGTINTLEANVDINQKAVQIKWLSKDNNAADKFIIEKSADKQTWMEVSTVFGASHKNQSFEYFHLDNMPLENLSYYRVVEISKTGKEIISNMIPVNYLLTENTTAGANLFPALAINGEQTIVNIAFEEIFEREILLVLRDKKGAEFYSKALINIENEKLVAVPMENEIPSGEYLITATSENQIYSQNVTVN